MPEPPQFASAALTVAAFATVIAALAHFACIVIGPSAYRAMGAGTRALQAIERGELRPHVAALVVGSALLLVAAYALSGAGILPPFPLLRWVLGAFSLALLARAFLFPLLRPRFPGNSQVFWLVSSAACLILGCLYLVGAIWSRVVP